MEIVCKGCYAKSYSVTSEWCTMSGGDALKLLSTTTIMPGEGDSGENCPRCEVGQRRQSQCPHAGATEKFSTTKECQRKGKPTTRGNKNEKKQQSKNIIQMRHLQKLRKEHWNKGHLERSVAIATPISFQREGCLKVLWECKGCRLGMLMSIVGKDDEIYCKSCYARKFGAPGYRGAGCGDWTDAKVISFYPKNGKPHIDVDMFQSAETLRPNTSSDVSKIKGDEKDPSTCQRCKVDSHSHILPTFLPPGQNL